MPLTTMWPLIRFVESAEEVEQRAFAAAGRPAESDGLALRSLEVDATKHGDSAVVVALPHVFGAENDLSVERSCGEAAHSKRSASTARMRIA